MSSATEGSAAVVPFTTVGASLDGVTVKTEFSVVMLYRVEPPLTETSLVPIERGPDESSTNRTVSTGTGPLKLAAGTKRILAAGGSSRAAALETAPMLTQVVG